MLPGPRDESRASRIVSKSRTRVGRVARVESRRVAEVQVQSPEPEAHSPESGVLESLTAIREDIGECVRCKLCTLGRKQIVFGVGNPNADLMFVGEAPGRDEDTQGIPFVGRAGQKLTQIIEAIGLKREDVYIANVIKCRPQKPQSRADEVERASRFLFVSRHDSSRRSRRARHVRGPKSISSRTSRSAAARRVFEYRARSCATFHPAFSSQSEMPARGVGGHEEGPRALRGEDVVDRCGGLRRRSRPFLDVLTYQVPDGLAPPPRGARVVVPLGKRVVTGIVVDSAAALDAVQPAADKIKHLLDVLDDDAFLPGPVVDLALWVADYYACGAGDALAARPSTRAHKTIRVAMLTARTR